MQLRPRSLAEVVRDIRNGADWRDAVAEFLDEFYLDPPARQAMLDVPPTASGEARLDAYLGAVAQYLAERWGLVAPSWTEEPGRFLDWPYNIGADIGPRAARLFVAQSPTAFRRRFIFTEAEPLRRARMPLD